MLLVSLVCATESKKRYPVIKINKIGQGLVGFVPQFKG